MPWRASSGKETFHGRWHITVGRSWRFRSNYPVDCFVKTEELTSATTSCALVQQAADEAAIKQLKLDLGAHKAHIDMLGSKLEQVTAEVHMKCNALNLLPC